MLDTILLLIGLASPPITVLTAVLHVKKDTQFYGLSNTLVDSLNKSKTTDFDLDLEEMRYIFRRDFNYSVLELREYVQRACEIASDNIASR